MPAQEIRVVHRSDESGTTDSFQQYLQPASAGAWTRGAGNTFKGGVGQGAPGNQGTAEAVETTPGAITYNEWSSAINQELATADIRTPAGVTPSAPTGRPRPPPRSWTCPWPASPAPSSATPFSWPATRASAPVTPTPPPAKPSKPSCNQRSRRGQQHPLGIHLVSARRPARPSR